MKFFKILEILKFWNLKILKFYEILWNFMKTEIFNKFLKIWNLLYNPVAELKIREDDSRYRSIVKQLEKEKNSNFNIEKIVVMFIYWGTIILYFCRLFPYIPHLPVWR